jgi:hypothetical protein
MGNDIVILENYEFFIKVKWSDLWSINSTPTYTPRRIRNTCMPKPCIQIFIAALVIITKVWKWNTCPPTTEQINKIWKARPNQKPKRWYVCILEYYLAIKRNTVPEYTTWIHGCIFSNISWKNLHGNKTTLEPRRFAHSRLWAEEMVTFSKSKKATFPGLWMLKHKDYIKKKTHTICYVIPSMWNAQNRQVPEDKVQICHCLGLGCRAWGCGWFCCSWLYLLWARSGKILKQKEAS